jgi:hypothetical protein
LQFNSSKTAAHGKWDYFNCSNWESIVGIQHVRRTEIYIYILKRRIFYGNGGAWSPPQNISSDSDSGPYGPYLRKEWGFGTLSQSRVLRNKKEILVLIMKITY